MITKKDSKNRADELRQQAEKVTVKNAADMHKKMEALPPEAERNLLHESRVHQIEKEKQEEELRPAQEEFKESPAIYSDQYNMAPVGYFSINEKGVILEANLTGANLLGVTLRDLRAQRFTSFIFDEDQDIYHLHRRDLFKTRARQVCEMRMVHKDGSLFWAYIEAVVAQDSKSGNYSCIATMIDITERKLAEEALWQEKEVLQTILDNIPVMIASFDREGHYQWINRCWQSTLGWSLMEVLQTDINAELYPDTEYRKHVADFIATHGSTWSDFRTRARDGACSIPSGSTCRSPTNPI